MNSIFQDVLNFFRNQFLNIITIIFLSTLSYATLIYILFPRTEQIISANENLENKIEENNLRNSFYQITTKQRKILLQISVANTIANLFNNSLLTSMLLNMINLLNKRKFSNIFQSIISSFSNFFHLTILIFLITISIQFGLFFFLIPGIILAVSLSLSPVILVKEKLDIMKSIKISTNMAFLNVNLIFPIILFWFLLKIIIFLSIKKVFILSLMKFSILLNLSDNFISSLLLIYLYRLYMFLTRK